MDTKSIIVTVIIAIIGSGALNTIVINILSEREKKRDRKNGIQQALRLLMKDRLRFLCIHYISQGWIYEDELEDIIAMHNCYHDGLKGNGFLDKLMEKVLNLEVRGIGVK